ncbi:hypothetical protein AAFF_G00216120 [Aldrovandia affinis]|uniref:Galactosyltransferase N-terminal domain-containing protein n=1 Tax=Aldrovandia affinis TaxID=143900 RepID=A0AAD7RG26_9TELE|nr:hypothetical protein AAFF_G00216120 [Aldrovandia affinis]
MGLCTALFKFFRKVKYLLLILLAVSVLAWIATFGNDTLQDAPRLPETQSQVQYVVQRGEKNSKDSPVYGVSYPLTSPSPVQQPCPQPSPLLQGAQKLTFLPSLTLKEVERENDKMVEGQYHPADCIARQSVAILIPHRNREKHLLYLLHHLLPFLQRQQLHYAIYIIHQAGEVTFNRAKLLNVGYLEALKDYGWDCFIFPRRGPGA